MKNIRNKIPVFRSEAEEKAFWSRKDSTDYFNWNHARRVRMPNLKPSLRTISIRLPEAMLAELKLLANKRDVPYQSLMKLFLSERIRTELKSKTSQ